MPDNNDVRARLGLSKKEEQQQQPGNEGAGGQNQDHNQSGDDQDTGGTTDQGQQQQPQEPQMSEAQVLEYVRRLNPNISSLEELKPTQKVEDEETKKKKRQAAVVSWALKTEKISPDKYNKFQVDSAKEPRQIVYEDYAQKRKAQNATPEQIEREFSRLWMENDDTPEGQNPLPEELHARQVRAEEMERESRRILKRRYPEMQTLDKDFDSHMSAKQKEADEKARYTMLATQYNTDINEAVAAFKKVTYTVGDEQSGGSEDLEFEFLPEDITTVKNEFLDNKVMLGFIADYDKAALQGAMKLRLLELTDSKRIAHISKRYHSEKMKKAKRGRNNLNVDEITGGSHVPERDNEMYQRLGDFAPHKEEAAQ